MIKAEPTRIVVIDLCAAILAPRLPLEAAIKVMGDLGVETAIYSALDAWTTRRALRMAGIMELFDYVWHMDAMMAMREDELEDLRDVIILNTPEQLSVKSLCNAAGIPASKVPPWLRWLV